MKKIKVVWKRPSLQNSPLKYLADDNDNSVDDDDDDNNDNIVDDDDDENDLEEKMDKSKIKPHFGGFHFHCGRFFLWSEAKPDGLFFISGALDF